MDYVLMILSIFIFTVQTISFKEFNRSFMKNISSYYFFNLLYFGMVVSFILVMNKGIHAVHTSTLLLAISFGIFFVVGTLLYMKAMQIGPLSYTSLMYSCGLIVPIILGSLLWKENISILQLIGLALLFITFYMGSGSSSNSSNTSNVRWLLISIAALICNGGIMAVSKAQQMILPGKESNEFLILGFGTALLLSLILLFVKCLRTKGDLSHLKNKKFVYIFFAAGISTTFGNQIALYLSGRIPAIIQFPTVNGGVVILASIASIFIFKEALPKKGIFGLLLGLSALVLLSL